MEPPLNASPAGEETGEQSTIPHTSTEALQSLRRVGFRLPAAPIAISLCGGIIVDRYWPIYWVGSLLFTAIAVVLSHVFFRKRWIRSCSVSIVVACFAAGAAWHHYYWWLIPANEISLVATSTPRPALIEGTIIGEPFVVPARENASWDQSDRTVCQFRCESLVGANSKLSVSGVALLTITGDVASKFSIGDKIKLYGLLSLPSQAQNPGDFDYRRFLRSERIHSLIRVQTLEAVTIAEHGNWTWWIAKLRSLLRSKCDRLFRDNMSPETRPLAQALILGNRHEITRETRTTFAESGAMHLLAISGLHVGILAGFVWAFCRVFLLSPTQSAMLVLVTILLYAFVTDARPPVIRAVILLTIAAIGIASLRQSIAMNSLSIAVIVVLMRNPTDLFDVGAHLSFLAVIAILWAGSLLQRRAQARAMVDREESSWMAGAGWRTLMLVQWAQNLGVAYLISGCVWLITMPLIAYSFNLVAPIGILINVLLIPVLVVTLWFGFVFLMTGFVVPPLAPAFGWCFDGLLKLLLWAVDAASHIWGGHFYVPSPPYWWLIVVYGLLGIAMTGKLIRISSKWRWASVFV